MYWRTLLARDGVTKLQRVIAHGSPPSVGDVVTVKLLRRRGTGKVTKVEPPTEQQPLYSVEIVVNL